jgi:phage tail sheath protein FI
MVNEYGKVMAFSAKTLFNGDNLGLQTYSVVRVFDYVTKVLMDFLNRRAFENFNAKTKKEIQGQILRFLDSITGPGKLIEKFQIKRFEQDKNQKDRIYLDIHMTPYFPAKSFMIKMDGQKGDDGNEWDTDYEQT